MPFVQFHSVYLKILRGFENVISPVVVVRVCASIVYSKKGGQTKLFSLHAVISRQATGSDGPSDGLILEAGSLKCYSILFES